MIHQASKPGANSHRLLNLLSNPNDPARRACTRITRELALLVFGLAQIIGASVHDNRPAQDALGPNQLDLLVREAALGVAPAVRLEVAQVADVALVVVGGAVCLGEGIDCDGERAVSARGGDG